MKIARNVSVAIAYLLASFAASDARAIPLPDTSNCSNDSHCLKITNNSSSGFGVFSQGHFGIYAASTSATSGGIGIFGSGIRGPGVKGYSTNEDAVIGTTAAPNRSGVAGVHTGTNGVGVYGEVSSSGTGKAIFGWANNSSTAWAGYFGGRVSATSYVTSSDARLKKDIESLAHGMDSISKLRPVSYRWNNGESDQHPQLGLVAQEVQKTIPELVEMDAKSGMLSVNYQGLVPVVIKALQGTAGNDQEAGRAHHCTGEDAVTCTVLEHERVRARRSNAKLVGRVAFTPASIERLATALGRL